MVDVQVHHGHVLEIRLDRGRGTRSHLARHVHVPDSDLPSEKFDGLHPVVLLSAAAEVAEEM